MTTRRTRWYLASAAALALFTISARAPGHGNGPQAFRWTADVRSAGDALARKDLAGAEQAWHRAYIAALGSWHWEGLVEVGDVALRIAELSGQRQTAAARARNLYLTALFRARQQNSLDGILRVAEAFARLGDRDVVAQCLRIAERLAVEARDPEAPARVHAFGARLADALFATGEAGP